MKIESATSLRSNAVRRPKEGKHAQSSGFADALAESAESPSAPSSASGLGPVHGLVALQEVPDATTRRRQAQKRGEELLDRLDDLRHSLLMGHLPRARLEQIAAVLADRADAIDDPKLAEIIAEIELRVAVELAKLGA